jgi:iron complex transport system substrate-binding protein
MDLSQSQLSQCRDVEEISAQVVDAAYHVHERLGPGLLELVYEAVLARVLTARGLEVARHVAVPFEVDGQRFEEGLIVDLLVNQVFVVELKSVETVQPVHYKQLLTYLKLLGLPVGLLINYGAPTFREGIRRVVNGHTDFASSRLRVNRQRS